MARLVALEELAIEAGEGVVFRCGRDRLEALCWLADKVIGPVEDAGDLETAGPCACALPCRVDQLSPNRC